MALERTDDRRRAGGRRLTDRQTAILELVAMGLENKEIAHRLGISEQAVKEHVSNLLRALSAPNRAALGDAAATLRLVGTTNLSPEWLSLLFLRAPLLIALLEGPEHRFLAANEAYRRAAGNRELIGLTFREAFPVHDEAGVIKQLDDAFRTGEPGGAPDVRARWKRSEKGFEEGYLTTLVQPVRRDDGTIAGTVFFAIDATTEVEARNAVRVVSHELQTILEQLPSGVVTVDTQGVVTNLNAAGREILGGDDLVGRVVWDAITWLGPNGTPLPPDDRPLKHALGGRRFDVSHRRGRVKSTGAIVDIRVSASPLFDEQQQVRGAVAIFTPVGRRPA